MSGRAIIVRLAEMTRAVAAQELGYGQLAANLRELADWVDGLRGAEKAREKVKKERPTAVLELFEYWIAKTKRDTQRVKLTPERRRALESRLRSYSVQDIKDAIDHVASSPWHQGENDAGKRYDDIITICRNDTKLESYRNSRRHGDEMPGSGRVATGEEGLGELLARSREALRTGDTDGYAKAQQAIERLEQFERDGLAEGGG